MTRRGIEAWVVAAAFLSPLAAPALAAEEGPQVQRGAEVLPAATPTVFSGDVRSLPIARDWQPGDPIKEIPRRSNKPPVNVPAPQPMRDPLLALQDAVKTPSVIGAPILNFAGGGFTGVVPPDTVGDVGPNHYIQVINAGSGAQFRIYNKSGTLVAGPTQMDSLGATQCASGLGDGIVLYDQLADRWLMAEFSTAGNRICIYISQTPDPVSGGWFAYQFLGNQFPDYPKYGVWPDAYYCGTNENLPAAYAFQRAAMLQGISALGERFTAPPLSGFGFQMVTPADADGSTPPPNGAPGTFWRHRDSESHGSPGGPDSVQYFEFHVDFVTPPNSTFTGPIDINVSEFDSNLCGLSSFNCFPQPGTGVTLDPLREVVMHRPQYRNRGTHEALVGSFVTDVNGSDLGGVRWFEARRVGGGPYTLFQEGTYSIDSTNRWMSSIAMDGSGNIALGYNVTSTSVFPGLRYTGRVSTDPPGTMGVEQQIIAGTASSTTNRYGDYSSMNVDPADECTFWWTGEFNASGQWSTRIATFSFPVSECIPVPVRLQSFDVK